VSEEVNRKCPRRNTMVQLSESLHRPWAPQYTSSQTDRDRQTDRQTHANIAPTDDHIWHIRER